MPDIYQEINKMTASRERGVLITIVSTDGSVPREAGSKMLVKEGGASIGTIGGGDLELAAVRKAGELIKSPEPSLFHFDISGKEVAKSSAGDRVDIFFEPIACPDTLFIFGAGHISKPVAAIGKMLGFQVVVVDSRNELNNRERFPEADSLIVEGCLSGFSKLNIGEKDPIIIATPSHQLDEDCLNLALGTKAKYIGMVGSRRKMETIREHLTSQGLAASRLDTVHTPIGLDIGAETPEEIAVSIMAEIVALRRKAN